VRVDGLSLRTFTCVDCEQIQTHKFTATSSKEPKPK